MQDIKIDGLDAAQAALAQVVVEDVLEQLGYTWDYTETAPDNSVLIKNVVKE
jgi:hypothetical protein